jgi:hypothetical protein
MTSILNSENNDSDAINRIEKMDNNAPNDATHEASHNVNAIYECSKKTSITDKTMVDEDVVDSDFKMPIILLPASAAFILLACSFVISLSVAIYVTIDKWF